MDKKQKVITERRIGKITYLVQALPSEKATDTIHNKIEKLIMKDLQTKPGKPALSHPSSAFDGGIWYHVSSTLYLFIRLSERRTNVTVG